MRTDSILKPNCLNLISGVLMQGRRPRTRGGARATRSCRTGTPGRMTPSPGRRLQVQLPRSCRHQAMLASRMRQRMLTHDHVVQLPVACRIRDAGYKFYGHATTAACAMQTLTILFATMITRLARSVPTTGMLQSKTRARLQRQIACLEATRQSQAGTAQSAPRPAALNMMTEGEPPRAVHQGNHRRSSSFTLARTVARLNSSTKLPIRASVDTCRQGATTLLKC